MKTQITLSTLFLSLLTLIVVGCGDNSTNSPKVKERYKDPLAGTGWKFIAHVDGETGEMKNPYYEIKDFDNIDEDYFSKYKYALTVFFCKEPYRIIDGVNNTKDTITLVGCGLATPLKEGAYSVIPNTNTFEYFGMMASWGENLARDIVYGDSLLKRKSFRLNADTLKLYSTLDSTGSYMLYLKSNLPVPRDTNKADNP